MTTVAERTDRHSTRSHPGRQLGWAIGMIFADRGVWRRLMAMAVGIGICSLALLALASIAPTVERTAARVAALQPTDGTSHEMTFLYHYVSFASDEGTVTGALLSGSREAPAPPGTPSFPQLGQIYASPRLAALLAAPGGGDIHALLPGQVIGVLPVDRVRGPDDLFFYRGAEPTSLAIPASGWGRNPDLKSLDPKLWVLLATGSVLLLIPLVLFVGLASRLGSARRERRNGLLALLGAGRGQVRLLGAMESGTAGLLGLMLGFGALLVLREFTDRVQFAGVGLQAEDIGPTAVGGWWVSIGVVAVTVVSGSLVGYRPADAARPQGSIPPRRRPFRWWWRVLLVATTAVSTWWLVERSNAEAMSAQPEIVRILLPCVAALLVMLTLVAVSAPLIVLACKLWRPASTVGQLARGRILQDGVLSTRSAAALAAVLAGIITLLPLMTTGSGGNRTTNTFGVLEGTLTDITTVDSAARRSDGLEYIGISARIGGDVRDDVRGPQLSVVTCPIVHRIDPGTSCRDGDVFRYPRADPASYPLPHPPYRIRLLANSDTGSDPVETFVMWSPPTSIRQLRGDQDSAGSDLLLSSAADADFLLTPAAALREIPSLRTDRRSLQIVMQLQPGSEPRQRLAMATLGDQSFGSMEWSSTDQPLDAFRPLIVGALAAVVVLVLLISALAQVLTTVEQIRERKRPYALGRAAGVPLSLLSLSIGLSLIVPILVTMVAAVGAGLLLNVVLGRLPDIQESAIAWPVVGIGTGAAVLAAALVALGASWSLQRSTRPAAMRTE